MFFFFLSKIWQTISKRVIVILVLLKKLSFWNHTIISAGLCARKMSLATTPGSTRELDMWCFRRQEYNTCDIFFTQRKRQCLILMILWTLEMLEVIESCNSSENKWWPSGAEFSLEGRKSTYRTEKNNKIKLWWTKYAIKSDSWRLKKPEEND